MKASLLRTALRASFLLGLLTFERNALAGDAALAESLFRDGRALMEAKDYAAACPKLAESFVQDPATGTLLALAVCQEESGKTASAWASYAEVITRAKQEEGRADREQAAREHMTALEPKLSKLKVEVDATTASVPGLVVTRDGVALGKGAWGTAAPVDPGEHVVEATAPGKRPFSAKVTVGENADAQAVTVGALEEEPEAAGAAAAPPESGQPVTVAEGDASASEGPPLRTIGLIVGGVGVVGLGLGGFFGLRAMSLDDDSKAGGHCDASNECDDAGLALRDDAISAATLSTVSFIAGGVLAAAGVTLFIVGGPKDPESDSARVEAVPVVGLGEAAMTVRGRF